MKTHWKITWAFCAISALLAILNFGGLLRRRGEGARLGSLGAIRTALFIYYNDMAGVYPTDMATLTVGGKYLEAIPRPPKTPNHPERIAVILNGKGSDDAGGWTYNNDPADADWGGIHFNCTHTDNQGTSWNSY